MFCAVSSSPGNLDESTLPATGDQDQLQATEGYTYRSSRPSRRTTSLGAAIHLRHRAAISSALQSHAPWGMRWGHLLPLQTLAVTFLRRMGAMTVSSTTFLSPHAFYFAILQPCHRTARRLPSQLSRVVDRYCLHQAWNTASMHLRQTSGDSHQVLQLLRTQRTTSPASLEPIIHSPGRSLALVSLLILLSSFFGFGLRFF